MRDWKKWFQAASIRAIKTFAEVMGGFVLTGLAMSEVNWSYAVSVSLTATIGSLLWSLKGLPEISN